ncbi:D-alanine--D-alanine ligase family protein [Aquifex pyrophilus]
MGGKSSEREISLKTGEAVAKALRELGHEVYTFDLTPELPCKLLELKPDKVFIALHGRPGEDGTVQGMLEILGIPYTGSDTIASAVCIDKDFTKRILQREGIKTPKWEVIYEREDLENLNWDTFPAVVKPAREGSSIGLKVVSSFDELKGHVEELLKKTEKVMIEEFIKGRELTVGMLKGEPLPVIEIRPKKGVYDYESKYTKGMSEYVVIEDETLTEKLHEISKKIYKVLSLKDFARIDFRLSEDGEIYFLEVNTIPGMTELSLLPMSAKAKGIDFRELINIIISEGGI